MKAILRVQPGRALPSPIPIAVLTPENLEHLGLAAGRRAIAVSGRLRIAVWIRSTVESPQSVEGTPLDPSAVVWMSRRARDLLRLTDDPMSVELLVADPVSLEVMPSLVDDLPAATEVDVSAATARKLGKLAIGYGQAGAIPLRVRRRGMRDDHVRMSALTRSLAGLRSGKDQRFVLSPFDAEKLHWVDENRGRLRRPGIPGSIGALILRVLRFFWWGLEVFLRLLFHSPPLPMRTVEAQLGDDTNRVVRMSKEAFALLGVKPGDEVFVEWADRRVVAVAHETFEVDADSTTVATVDTWQRDEAVPSIARHLIIGIAAEMRGELRIPRRTVVVVRRRVLSLFAQRINEVTVPVGGLLLAALTIRGLSHTFVVAGIVVVTILAMLPARYRVPPRGRWP